MGVEWGNFAQVFEQCLQAVQNIPPEKKAWEERRPDASLVEAMRPWVSGTVKMDQKAAAKLPDDFLGLWSTHIQHKLFFKTEPASVIKKKIWSSGREGLVILAIGLRWAWLKLKDPKRKGTTDQWIKMVVDLTTLLSSVVSNPKSVFGFFSFSSY